ncbi:MAG TPA: hypothetical protein VGM50_02320 [Gemmatimonadaceae bacterium]
MELELGSAASGIADAFEEIRDRALQYVAKNVDGLELDTPRLVVKQVIDGRVGEAGLRLQFRLRHPAFVQQFAQAKANGQGDL